MKKDSSGWFVIAITLCAVLLLPAQVWAADNVRITGAFTTYTGPVVGNVTYMSYCGADSCLVPGGAPPPLICPDGGCDPNGNPNNGIATNFPLGNAQFDGPSSVSFWALGPLNIVNNLTFTPARGVNGLPLQIDPTAEFQVGTISFTNGTWYGNAAFGFSIVLEDSSSGPFHGVHTFTGFLNLGLTPNDPTKSPAANADWVYFTDLNGVALRNPFTAEALGSLRVYEAFDAPAVPGVTNTGTAAVYAKLGSLDLTRLADPTGGGFLDISVTADLGGPPPQTALYQICPLYDQNVAKKSGSAYPIKLQLCDANGNNLSSASIVVHATSVTRLSTNTSATLDDTGNANPDFGFRYDPSLGGYIFNLSTSGYASGTYSLNFTAGADPVPHAARFAVK